MNIPKFTERRSDEPRVQISPRLQDRRGPHRGLAARVADREERSAARIEPDRQRSSGQWRSLRSATLTTNATVYSAGVDLDLPIDRVAERNTYRSSLITLERSERAYNQLKDEVAADARDALRVVRSSEISLEIQRRGHRTRPAPTGERKRAAALGKRDNRDVVDAQQALLRAQDAYEQAKATLQIQVLTFLRSTGILRVDPEPARWAAGPPNHATKRRSRSRGSTGGAKSHDGEHR